MRYHPLRHDARGDHWHTAFIEGVPLDHSGVGLPVDAPHATARVTVASAHCVPSDILELPCPVVSDAMRRALDGAGVDNVQYFPANADEQYTEGHVITRYCVANVVGAVACAEAPLSTTPAGGAPPPPPASSEPRSSFRIDPARARGLDLFRPAENRSLLVVRECVAGRLRAAGPRGLLLQPPREYTRSRVNTSPPELVEEEVGPGAEDSRSATDV